MNKYILLAVSIFLGILYSWSGLLLAWLSAFLFMGLDPSIFFVIIPLIFCFFTGRYYIKKRYGYLPIAGLMTGFVMGYILLSIGMAGA
jgi:hypothetical protein